MDIVDRETRSRMMAGIRSKNTSPEIQVRKFLHASGFRFRLHVRKLPGNPDIVLPKYRVAILVHGCFWHNHDHCKKAAVPKENAPWAAKLQANKERDRKAVAALLESGWRVIVIWECGLGRKATPPERLAWLIDAVKRSTDCFIEWPALSVADANAFCAVAYRPPIVHPDTSVSEGRTFKRS